LFEEGWSKKLLIDVLHLVPHTLVCTCCSKSMAAAMQLSVPSFSVALLSHL
jgi:hypothetical protein